MLPKVTWVIAYKTEQQSRSLTHSHTGMPFMLSTFPLLKEDTDHHLPSNYDANQQVKHIIAKHLQKANARMHNDIIVKGNVGRSMVGNAKIFHEI